VNITSLQSCGVGFAGSDGLFAYYGGFSTMNQQTPFKVARASAGGAWSWNDLPPIMAFSQGPPQNLAVATGSTPRELLYNGFAIWDITGRLGSTMMWPTWSASALTPSGEGGFSVVRFPPGDSNTLVVAMAGKPTLHRCAFASTLTCDSTDATGLAAGDTISGVDIAAADPQRVYVMTRSPTFHADLYTSTDGARTFLPVPQPSSPVSFAKWTVSPTAPDTVALYFPAYENDAGTSFPDRLLVTHDRGASWTQISLPVGPGTTDVDGITFDAAGTLYVARGSVVFSTDV
jgi:hypothetical protein